MTSEINQAREDLDFLKTIVSEGPSATYGMGLVYCVAGILFGIQCTINWIGLVLPSGIPTLAHLINGVVPTALLLIFIFVFLARDPRAKFPKGPVNRAIAAAFSGAGIANLFLVAVFAIEAIRRDDFSIWLFYGVTVCILQGAVWYGAAFLRRRWWMGGVAAGWMVTGLIAGLFIPQPEYYVLTLGFAMFAFMAVPGYILVSISRTQ